MYTFPPTIFVIDLRLYSSDKRERSAGVSGVENALRARQASAPFRATTFQKRGLKQIAAADTQRDCLEKSTREERGGSEEAIRRKKRGPQFFIHHSTRTAIDYVHTKSERRVECWTWEVMGYEAKLVKSNRWIIEVSGKSWMTIPSLMARVF